MRLSILTCAALAIAAPAGANEFARFYTPAKLGTIRLVDDPSPPELLPSSGDINKDIGRMWEQGYRFLGESSFNGMADDKTKAALKFAKTIRARFVILDSKYQGTRQGTTLSTQPFTTTVPTSGSVVINGSVAGTYSGTATVHGLETTTTPYSVNRFDYDAAFFALAEKRGTGILGITPSQSELSKMNIRAAQRVLAIRSGSPSSKSGLVKGDLIVAIDGEIADDSSWNRIISSSNGTPINITYVRDNVTKSAIITIPKEWMLK